VLRDLHEGPHGWDDVALVPGPGEVFASREIEPQDVLGRHAPDRAVVLGHALGLGLGAVDQEQHLLRGQAVTGRGDERAEQQRQQRRAPAARRLRWAGAAG